MGYNTTVVVLNDALEFIAGDPLFGDRLKDAVLEAGSTGKRVDVEARLPGGGVHCNAASVIETHHADFDVYVRVGGNYGEVVANSLPELIEKIKPKTRRANRGAKGDRRT